MQNTLEDDINDNNSLIYYRIMFLLATILYPSWYFIIKWITDVAVDSLSQRMGIGLLIFCGYLYTFSPRYKPNIVVYLFFFYANLVTIHIFYLVYLNNFSGFYQLVSIVAFACIAASMSTVKMLGSYIILTVATLIIFSSFRVSTNLSMLFICLIITLGCTFWPPLSMRMKLLNRVISMRRDLNLIVSNAAAGILSFDIHGNIISANSEVLKIFGYQVGVLKKMPIYDLIHPLQRADIKANIDRFINGLDAPDEFIVLGAKSDGNSLWTRFRLSPILDRAVAIGCVAVVIDVTAEQEANSIILAQKSLLETLITCDTSKELCLGTAAVLSENLNHCPVFIWRMEEPNKSPEIFGYANESGRLSLGLPQSHLNALVFQLLGQASKGLAILSEPYPKDGPPSSAEAPSAPCLGLWHGVLDVQGQSRGVFLTIFRMTKDPPSNFETKLIESCASIWLIGMEKIKANEIITAQQTQITQSAKMASLGEMAGGIAHEINNPLAILRGRFEQLRSLINSPNPNSEMALKYCESGIQMIDRLKRIIQGLRQFSRDGARDPFARLKLSEVVNDTLVFCSEKFKTRGVLLEIDAISNSFVIEGRHTQISQVILNLLNNAFDAVLELPEKWVKLAIDIHPTNPKICRILVTDSGRGIPQKTVDKLFQPFFTTKIVGQGTGLGLSISLGIVKEHGGSLTYDATSANTRFIVELPLGT